MSLNRLIPAILLAFLFGCRESDEDKANRAALAPLVQRSQSLTAEIGAAEKTHATETWTNLFERLDGYIKEKESIQKDLRGVVPTPKFACITGVLARSLTDDITALEARSSAYHQSFKVSTSLKQAKDYSNEAVASEYSSSTYFKMAKDAIAEAQEALSQETQFREAADSAARRAVARADTLRFLSTSLKLVPAYPPPVYVIMTDSVHPLLSGTEITEASCKS